MTTTALEDILACPDLPSLPAVALQVIELTSDQNVSMDELSRVIQNDQALAAKVLRTVNSSFYGLRERCATIRKAIVMLGLSPVKTLTLSFSLVSSIDSSREPNFDYQAYWRRGLYSAVGARMVCEASGLRCGDEAFLAALLQDIGVVAMHKALGDDYLMMMARTEGDHSRLVKEELTTFDLQHPEIGAMLAQRWRLPPELVVPIRYHERPTAAPKDAVEITRAVAMGVMAHDVLTDADPSEATRRFYARGNQWFRLGGDACQQLLKQISTGAAEMAKLFHIDVGAFRDAEAVLEQAERRLIDIGTAAPRESVAASKLDAILKGSPETDSLTGVPSRKGFEVIFPHLFTLARDAGDSLSLAQVAIDRLSEVIEAEGQVGGDRVVLGVLALLNKHFEPLGGVVCRLGASVFSIILPATELSEARRVAELMRNDTNRLAPTWSTSGVGVTASVGVSCLTQANASELLSPDRLLLAGTKAVQAARGAGGNCVRTIDIKAAA